MKDWRKLLLVFVLCLVAFGQPARNLRERAEQGDAEAQFNLAKNLETGRAGFKRNPVEAERWYRAAAVQGDPFAQASLAILYRFGKGIKQDLVEAYVWFDIAAAGVTGADRESIAELRDGTAAKMSKEQIEAARRRVQEGKR